MGQDGVWLTILLATPLGQLEQHHGVEHPPMEVLCLVAFVSVASRAPKKDQQRFYLITMRVTRMRATFIYRV